MNLTVSISDEAVARLDEISDAETRTKSQQVQHMIMSWGKPSHTPPTKTPKPPKPETLPPAGADGNLIYMSVYDTRTLPPGSRWLMTWQDALPLTYMKVMPWAYRTRVVTERQKNGKATDKETQPPKIPVNILTPDDFADITTPLRLYRLAYVASDHLANTPKTYMWVSHGWNAALGQWVPDPADMEACQHDKETYWQRTEKGKIPQRWLEHRAYGANNDAQLRELLTALEPEFNLTDDAKAFIAGA